MGHLVGMILILVGSKGNGGRQIPTGLHGGGLAGGLESDAAPLGPRRLFPECLVVVVGHDADCDDASVGNGSRERTFLWEDALLKL